MHKKIIIPPNTAIIDWVDENRDIVMGTLYDNIFEFTDSEEEKRIVLEVIMKHNFSIEESDYQGISMDFVITKDGLDETIDRLISHYEDFEEYEKCAELVKLK